MKSIEEKKALGYATLGIIGLAMRLIGFSILTIYPQSIKHHAVSGLLDPWDLPMPIVTGNIFFMLDVITFPICVLGGVITSAIGVYYVATKYKNIRSSLIVFCTVVNLIWIPYAVLNAIFLVPMPSQ